MNILHICSNYIGTKVHLNQVTSLANTVEKQNVIVPVFSRDHINRNNTSLESVNVSYFKINNTILKYFPLIKTVTVFFYILFKYSDKIRESNLIYSHTLWSNGLPAYLLSLIFRKRLIISIRSTDFFVFMKKLPHYRWIMRLIIHRAEKVIFISPSYKDKVMADYKKLFSDADKCLVIPNGIDNFWIEKTKFPLAQKKLIPNGKSFIFVARLNKTKRLELTIDIVNEIKKNDLYKNSTLTIIGCSEKEVLSYLEIEKLPSWIIIKNIIQSKDKLFDIYSTSHALILLSYQETFGLVYLEALASGCPVVLTKKEGISGYFSQCDSILEVDTSDIKLIASNIIEMPDFEFPRYINISKFSWQNYAKEIEKIL
ncbi:glycosyltransferase family 4 protein [Providencia rettgeri]|uniref:glycosyltransferase family 4 protein n=1 Tax=Providencia rettgeri TaxID=587 RepID=UPI0038509A44